MKFFAEVTLLLVNVFFLLANLAKVNFAMNPSSLSYLGLFLNIAQIIYFSIPVYKFWKTNRQTISTMKVAEE